MSVETQMTAKKAKERFDLLKSSGGLHAQLLKVVMSVNLLGDFDFDKLALTLSHVADSAVDPGEPVEELKGKAALFLAAHEFRQAAERLNKYMVERDKATPQGDRCPCAGCVARREAEQKRRNG